MTPHHLRWGIYKNGAKDGVDPWKVEHVYESGFGSWDGVDPHHTHIHTQTQNQLKLDVYGAEDEAGDNLIPNQLRLDRGQARHGVDSP